MDHQVVAVALGEGGDGVRGQGLLVLADRGHPRAPEIVDGRAEPDGLGDRRGAGLELPGHVVGGEPVEADVADHLAAAEEGRHGLEQLGPGPQGADPGRAEHLVAGEAEEVDAERLHVGRQVGGVLGPVDEDQGAGGVGGVGELGDRVDACRARWTWP